MKTPIRIIIVQQSHISKMFQCSLLNVIKKGKKWTGFLDTISISLGKLSGRTLEGCVLVKSLCGQVIVKLYEDRKQSASPEARFSFEEQCLKYCD
jgi:hypothetical protein